MKRKALIFGILLLSAVFLSGCSLKKPPAALQISTNPPANVFVDGKLVGKTPYQGSNWKEGEVTLKLIPESTNTPLSSWEGKVKLNSGVLTLIERDFASSESASSGQVLTLEKIKDKKVADFSLISDPDGALVHLDGEAKGFTPITLEKIGVGDHQILISKEGFVERAVKAKAITGFKLIVNVKLAPQVQEASPSAEISVTPTAAAGSKKGPSPTAGPSGATQVLIKDTPTGWLRVRSQAPSGAEVARVKPGEKYPVSEEKTISGTVWYKIEYEESKEGWISGQYASKI